MTNDTIPALLTPGRIAKLIGVSLGRVTYILATRPHIRPSALAGTIRLYDRQSLAMVRYEINAIDARRDRKSQAALPSS